VKRVLFGFVAAALVFFAGRAIVRSLASDETKIRWTIEEMVGGFNRERASPVMRAFSQDYRDETSDADRELVHQAVVSLFFRERDPRTKRFLLRGEIPEDSLTVEVGEEGAHATARGVLTVFAAEGEGEAVSWRVSFEGTLAHEEDGWRFVRSSYETLEGRRPR